MKISFGSWALVFGPYSRNPIPFPAAAERVSKAGYDGIEIAGYPPHITLEDYPSSETRRPIRQMLRDLGLAVSGYAPDFTAVNPTVEGNHARYLELFRRNVEMCADLGSPRMRVDTIAAPGCIGETEYADTMNRLAALWRDAADIAAPAGLQIVWEFEPGFVFNKPSEVVELYEHVGHPAFQILFDLSHAYNCGVKGSRQQGERETLPSVAAFLDLLSGRVGHIHVNDTDGTLYGEETSRHCPFGKGVIQFNDLKPKLKTVPGVNWWCVDLAFWPGNLDLMESSLAFVRKLSL